MDEEEVMTIVDTATWFEVWQAATALVGMCSRRGLSGNFLNFGKQKRQESAYSFFVSFPDYLLNMWTASSMICAHN